MAKPNLNDLDLLVQGQVATDSGKTAHAHYGAGAALNRLKERGLVHARLDEFVITNKGSDVIDKMLALLEEKDA